MSVTRARGSGWTKLRNAFRSRITTGQYLASRSDPASSDVLRFLAGLRNANGVWKTTAKHRLDNVLPAIVRNVSPTGTQVRALDVGCSSGLSTLELAETLAARGLTAEVFGTDVSLTAVFVSDERGRGMLFLDRDHVAQVEIDGWALGWPPAGSERLLHPIRVARVRALLARTLPRYLEVAARRRGTNQPPGKGPVDHGLTKRVERRNSAGRVVRPGYANETELREGRDDAPQRTGAEELIRGELTRRDVPLTVPIPNGSSVRFVQESVLEAALGGRFHAVLAANFLNRNYFPPEFLAKAVMLLRERLLPDGILCIVRTLESGENHGTIFRMTGGGPVVIERIGCGSEIEEIVQHSRRQVSGGV